MTTKNITIRSAMVKGAESKSLFIEVPAVSVPPCLRSGQQIVDEIEKLFERTTKARLEKKLERFLKRAQEGEAKKDYLRAGRAFALALYCDGMLRPEVTDPWGYVCRAMPVY
jgi:hypothetical protein